MSRQPSDAELASVAAVATSIASGTLLYQRTMHELGQPISDSIMLAAMLTIVAAMMRDAPEFVRKDALQQFILACEPLPVRHDA